MPKDDRRIATEIELICSTEEEKGQQIANVPGWQTARNALAPAGATSHGHMADADATVEPESHDGHGLGYLQQTARERHNVFETLIETLIEAVKFHSLGQISHPLYGVGGDYG